MKKSMKMLAAGLVAGAALMVSASASNFDHCADMLKTMNLFHGGTSGYELDRAPTRAEAAAMLVRLLGKESEASKLAYDAPFTDLEGWQQPYVQYLFDNKLTSGSTATTFDPEAKCDAKMYSTFLLRALGYSDADKDFSYDTAVNKAKEIGLIDGINCDEKNFLRDHVVAMSYSAMTIAPKDQSSKTLLEKLVKDGAISKEQANPLLILKGNYDEFVAASDATGNKMSMDAKIDVTAKLSGKDFMAMDMNMKFASDVDISDMNKSVISGTGNFKVAINPEILPDGEESEMSSDMLYYYANGMYYFSDGINKIKMPMDFNSAMSQMGDMTDYASEPFSAIKSITKKTADNVNTYTAIYAPGVLNSMTNGVLSSMNMADIGIDVKVGGVECMLTAADGKLSKMDMAMAIEMTVEGETMTMDMKMQTSNIKTGDDVSVSAPSAAELATYTDMASLIA